MNKTQNQPLESKLRKIEVEKEGNYDKRTEHLDDQGRSIFINRLILEDSPYLLQHAHNPVNWYAWGRKPSPMRNNRANRFFYRLVIPPAIGVT